MICTTILVEGVEEISDYLQDVIDSNTDIVDIRLDGIEIIEFSMLEKILTDFKELKIPHILSLRSEWLNKEIISPSEGRSIIMKKIIDLHPPYVTIEYPIDMPLLREIGIGTTPIISLVDFEGMAKIAFNSAITMMEKYPNAILKISATPNNVNDLLTMWRWAKTCNKNNIKHVILGMGMMGRITRIKSNELGNQWTYARFEKDYEEPQIPGMISLDSVRRGISDGSMHFLGLGNTVNLTVEKILDLITYKTVENGVFLNLQVNQIPELNQIMLWAKDNIVQGLFINEELQEQVVSILEIKDSSVITTGKCDTIINTLEGLKGFNSRVYAITRLIKTYAKQIKRVYIEGIDLNILAFLSALRNFEIQDIVVRTENRAIIEGLQRINNNVIWFEHSYNSHFDLFINCRIPYPGFEGVLPVSTEIIKDCKLIIDPLAINNSPTPLTEYAEKNSMASINGWKLLIQSLIIVGEIWFDESIPINQIINEITPQD